MYSILKKIFFALDPETAHYAALKSLDLAKRSGLSRCLKNQPLRPVTVMGLSFPNRIGLAAGFDKNGDYIDALAELGFGFIEIGTVTPRPQPGNPKPRLFRLAEQQGIINRMGFNNKGYDYVVKRLEKTDYRGILGINIGKNKDTPLENAIDDYLLGFRTFWKYASYITINVSSPNTPGLRDLQHSDFLARLLCVLKQEQHAVFLNEKKHVPLVLKISPDLTDNELADIAEIAIREKIEGIISTNTTIHREGVENSPYAHEPGGLSGLPLFKRSTLLTSRLHKFVQDRIPIIASGGVMDTRTGKEKLNAGAQLLQVYSGFIYSGPDIISQLALMD
ncbi:Dihydroorotate dehydrogenase (quinone) [Aquicella siphonis]|uniref:Dihydroorotate dehydrogenase (quinone) n=1 Tax=Aquicella siphonis TaxID=254247 RepID=A0A5E4PDF3_9COXI|nr:quinone-dependent dihydroorotate dehydrogenase [Aquicella siphonis]VVC74794.1 Dihydroorotate dehydrogenase (quinone) [Aquicella siphonis]